MIIDELKEWALKYLDIELYPYQEKFIEMLLRKKDPEQLKHEAIDKMVIDRVSRALIGYRIRKMSVFNAIMREIYTVTDPILMVPRHQGMKADLIVLDDIDEEIDLAELGEQHASEREGYDDR